MDLNQQFARAEQAFREGLLDHARELLTNVLPSAGGHPAVLHLLGLVEKGRGEMEAAQTAFEQALVAAPQDARIANNYGNLLLGMGDWEAALKLFDQALSSDPQFVEARFNRGLGLEKAGRFEDALAELETLALTAPPTAKFFTVRGSVLRNLGRLDEAAEAYDQALALDPARSTALHGRAATALESGEDRASAFYARAVAVAPDDLSLQLGHAQALQAEGDPDGLDRLEKLVAARPDWVEGQSALAKMRWQAGEGDAFARGFEGAVQQRPTDRSMWNAYVATLASADLWAEAARAAEAAFVNVDDADFLLLAASNWSEAGNVDRADEIFARLPSDLPGRGRGEVRHQLRMGHYDEALAVAEASLREDPWSVPVWAMLGLLWRLVDDPRAKWLHEQPGLVAAQQLQLDKFEIEQIAEVLRSLHRTRAHPLGESLRGGTQTNGRLFERKEPEVRMLRDAIARAVESHWAGLPPKDPTHPLLRQRDRKPCFAGSWSVRLTGGGYHVAHIHDGGALSSACYLIVPQTTEPQEGWLEIGRPPPELNLSLEPLTTVEPLPGRLVLFPSTLLHGTRPFARGERMTAAFDIVAQ